MRYEWYQTGREVVISIFAKNLKQENVRVEVTEQRVSVELDLGQDRSYQLHVDLAYGVRPGSFTATVFASKVDVRLQKADAQRWTTLERSASTASSKPKACGRRACARAAAPAPLTDDGGARPRQHDWDKLASEVAREEASEKLEGDAALQKLFQQIYRDGTDETRRAMNKSFVESGGTVLSTNWSEVGTKRVEPKPPDGAEVRQLNT